MLVMATDRHGRYARFKLKPGNAAEAKELATLLDDTPGSVHQLIADKAYDTAAVRAGLAAAGIDVVIPRNPRRHSRPVPQDYDRTAYEARHIIENSFAHLKHFRGVATRYCKLAVTFTELVSLVCWYINTR